MRFSSVFVCAIALSAALGLSACVTPTGEPTKPAAAPAPTTDFSQSAVATEVANWLGVSAETAATIVERVFSDLGEPQGFIRGEEASGAIGPGLRYGRGTLTLAGQNVGVYWQGPSVGWDVGANASKTFTLVYDLPQAEGIYRRFPGVEGTAYLVGGVGVNYQRAEGVTLVPMRAGVGARLGANIGYLAYSRKQRVLPF
ncbi:MAG: EipA family protein [Pseudomonadota bacterium]